MYVIAFYVPKESAEMVKNALFQAGAGKIGNYSHCAFQMSGKGQFLPEDQAQPAVGEVGQLEYVDEVKVELVCEKAHLKSAIAAMKETHPYEEVAFHVIESVDWERV